MCDNSIINCKAILNFDGSLLTCGTRYKDTADRFVLICNDVANDDRNEKSIHNHDSVLKDNGFLRIFTTKQTRRNSDTVLLANNKNNNQKKKRGGVSIVTKQTSIVQKRNSSLDFNPSGVGYDFYRHE